MVSRNKIRIGFPGLTFEIPAPSSGMNFGNNSDTEVTELDSGGRFVYRKATTYKSFNMSWRTVTPAVQPLLDMYNKRYGDNPFYMQDMRGGEGNILPARWVYSYQLATVFGAIGTARINGQYKPAVTFTGNRYYTASSAPTTKHMLHEGRDHYLAAFGTASGGSSIRYRRHNKATSVWTAWSNLAPQVLGTAPTVVCTKLETQTYDFIEISVNLAANGVLTLTHMDFSTTDYRSSETQLRSAEGAGALEFTNTLDGELVMLRAQRIGLSVDMTEVEVG